jgi:hypothetical protein
MSFFLGFGVDGVGVGVGGVGFGGVGFVLQDDLLTKHEPATSFVRHPFFFQFSILEQEILSQPPSSSNKCLSNKFIYYKYLIKV